MDPKPIFNATLLLTAAVYGFVLWIAMQAKLFGFLIGYMITLSLFRFSYHVLREVALGRRYITPPDLESTNPVAETTFVLHATLFLLLPVMFWLMPRIIDGPTGEYVRVLGLMLVLGTFPASVAVMAMTRNSAAALSPLSIGTVIKVLRGDYLILLAWCAAVVVLANLASRLLGGGSGVFDEIIGVWGFLALFALVGSAIRAHRSDFDYADVDEIRAQHVDEDRKRVWRADVDRAYASIRSGFVDQGYTTLKQLIAREHDSLEVYQWVFNRMLDWQEQKFALDLARRFVVRLVEEKREQAALDLIQQCRRLSPTFDVAREAAAHLSAYARSIGRPKLAEDLAAASAASPVPGSVAEGSARPARPRSVRVHRPRDQPRAASVGQVLPEPAQRYDHGARHADQEVDVREAPDPPREPAAQREERKLDHRALPADRREVAGVAIDERRRRRRPATRAASTRAT